MTRHRHGNKQTLPNPATNQPEPSQDTLPFPQFPRVATLPLVFFAAILPFLSSYDGDFVFDDSEAVTGNKDVTLEVPWTDVFAHDFWGNKITSNTSHKSYRPLTVLTLRWNYWLVDGLHPKGFHIVNIVLHGFICVLFLPTLDLLLEARGQGQGHIEGGGQGRYSRISTLCALLFAVHPIHTESVAAVVGRADLLCAVTYLLSIVAYHRAVSSGVSWLGLSMLLSVISTLCKEIGITALGICIAYDVIVCCRIDPLTFLRLRREKYLVTTSETKKVPPSRKSTAPEVTSQKLPTFRISVVMVTAFLLLIGRWQVMGSAPPTFQVVDNPHSFVGNPFYRLLNYNYLYSINAWLLLNPCWLCFDWSMGCVSVIESLLDPRLLAVCLFWFVSGAVIGYSLIKSPNTEQRQLLMGLALLIVPFLPASNLLFRVGFVIAERVLYLPSIGFIVLMVVGAKKLCKYPHFRKVLPVVLTILLANHAWRCHWRCLEWRTEKSLFESGAVVCPLNAKVHYNIAKVRTDAGSLESAIEEYRLALKLNPDYDQAMNNLGNILKDLEQLEEAEQLLLKATDIRPEFAAAWMNLGIVQASLDQTDNAERSYHNALRHRRNYPDCYYNLGNLYLSVERHALALTAWRNATLQKPTHVSAWTNIIILLDNLGRVSDVQLVAKEALAQNPKEASIYYNVGNALGKNGQYQDAEGYFTKALQLKPDIATYHSNLAVLYHRWGKLEQAEAAYRNALQLEPGNAQIQQNYNMLRRKRNKGS